MEHFEHPWDLLRRFCEVFCPCGHQQVIRKVTYRFKGVSFTAEGNNMSLVVKDTDVPGTVQATVSFKDAKGRDTKPNGVPAWAASDPTIVDSITPSADGLSATMHITDTLGSSNVTVSADIGGGAMKDFVDQVSVIAGDAVDATFVFGAVTPDTPAGP
jgi:hypothetical protein